MKLLVVSSRFPWPLEKGDKLRLYHQMEYLSRHHKIYLASLCDANPPREYIRKLERICHKVYCFKIPLWRRGLEVARAGFGNMPLQIALFYDPAIKRKIRRILLDEDIEHIYCQLVRTAEYVKNFPLPKTIDYMDAFSAGMKRRSAQKTWPYKKLYAMEHKRLSEYEAKVEKYFDHCTIISARDLEDLPVADKSKFTVIPNGVDTEYFKPMPRIKPKFDIVFVGNMGYEPNIEAAVRLVRWCRENDSQKGKAWEILIAGARPGRRVLHLAGDHTDVAGWMPDIREAYASARIFAAPLFSGAGLQNKILEAMSMGVPALTTSHVNASIGANPGSEIVIADDRQSFIQAAQRMLQHSELRNEIAANALEFVRNHYSWDEFNEQLDSVLQKPLPKHGFSSFNTIGT